MFKKFIAPVFLIFILLAVTIVTVGCGGGSTSQPAKQLLRVNLGGNPTTIDPQKAINARDISVTVQMFDGLLGFNQDLTIKAVVAREVPSTENGGISPDGLVYTFKLRQNVTWSDGQPVKAQDFVYAMKRLFTNSTGAPYRATYYVINNASQYRKDTKAGITPTVEIGVRAVDDYTLEITLNSQCQSFLERMALWAVYPIRQDVVEGNGDNWAKSPATYIGNGPFILKEWVADDHITLERNPNYWGTPAKLEEIRYAMYADTATEYLAYKSGDLDITRVPAGTERTMSNGTDLVSYTLLKTNALFLDNSQAPFNNAKLRQAFAMAINRSDLVDKLQGGRGSVTTCWVPAGMPGYDAAYQQSTGSQYAFDATNAKAKLAEALAELGLANAGALKITLYYSNVGSNPTIIQFIQEQLNTNLGVNIDAVGIGSASFYSRVGSERGKWNMVYGSFSTDYPDPDNWLPDFFGSTGGYNTSYFSQYSNTTFDSKVAEALAEDDTNLRLALWKEAEGIMVADAPAIFLFNDEMFVLKNARVEGLVGTAMDLYVPGDLSLASIYIK